MNKAITIIAVLAILFLAGILLFGSEADDATSGTVYFSVTDVAADMGNVTEVTMTTRQVELHSQTEGWVTASSNSESFDLLALNASGENQLWAEARVAEGTYDRVRMTIDRVEVTTDDGETVEATLPSEQITIDGTVNSSVTATSSVLFDVLADQSLHTAADSSFVFAPVVVMESRSGADVTVNESNTVEIRGGSVDANVSVGVDLAGESRTNFTLDVDQAIELNTNGSINVNLGGTPNEESTGENNTGASAGAGAEGSAGVETDGTGAGAEVETQGGVEVQY
ncbi:MAG: DUF4382 domain-containing protein [Candidatus Paceibacterota bacterium]